MKKIIPIRVDEHEHEMIKESAKRECRSVSSFMRYAALERTKEFENNKNIEVY